MPELPGRFDVRRDFVKLEHPLVPANNIRLQIPLPDANPARFVGERNALHQAFVDPLGLFQVVNIFNLGDEIERRAVSMTDNGDGEQRPDNLAITGVIAFLQRVGINFAAYQLLKLLKVGVQILRPGQLLEGEGLKLRLTIAKEIA